MLLSCWSVKGGSGTTVVTSALGLVLARRHEPGALLVDLAGDAPAALGLSEPDGPGVVDWLRAGPDVPDDGLRRIEQPVGAGLGLVPRGQGRLEQVDRAEALAALLLADERMAVVDCGQIGDGRSDGEVARVLAESATHSFLVIRPCYLALRRAVAAPIKPSSVIVVDEPGRALGAADIESILGVPVAATVTIDPSVAKAVDAGLLASRLPRGLERALRNAA